MVRLTLGPVKLQGYTYGYRKGCTVNPAWLRRIARIHCKQDILGDVASMFPTFFAWSDHKAFLLTLEANLLDFRESKWRFHCPTSFLGDEETMGEIKKQLEGLSESRE